MITMTFTTSSGNIARVKIPVASKDNSQPETAWRDSATIQDWRDLRNRILQIAGVGR